MKKLLIIVFCFSLFSGSAQISGYMGKKFSVFLSPGISFPHLSSVTEAMTPIPSFNFTGAVDYVISSNVAFGVKYKYAMATVNNKILTFNGPFATIRHEFEKSNFSSHTVGPYFKIYGKRKQAPLSTYFKVGWAFQILRQNNLVKNDAMGRPSKVTGYTYFDKQVFDSVINLGIGKNFILVDRLLLGFEVEAGMALISHGHNFLSFNGFGIENYNEEEAIYRTNFSNEILKVSLNVGFLAF